MTTQDNQAGGVKMEAVVKRAIKALAPFSSRVFNDNGDLTVNTAAFVGNEIEAAYFAHRALSRALAALPATGAVNGDQMRRAMDLAERIWCDLQEVRQDTNLTDAWYSAAECAAKKIIAFASPPPSGGEPEPVAFDIERFLQDDSRLPPFASPPVKAQAEREGEDAEPVAWRWRAKVKGEWSLWSVVEVDPNDWTWRDYWEELEVVPLFASPLPVEAGTVKPLEWNQSAGNAWHAQTMIGRYTVVGRSWWGPEPTNDFHEAKSSAAAKAAAQADYEARILSALNVPGEVGERE